MIDLASLQRARDLSEAIYEASRKEDADLLLRLQHEREEILSSQGDLSVIGRQGKETAQAAVRLLQEILDLNEKARALVEPWHQDVKNYLERLDENRRRYRPAGDAG